MWDINKILKAAVMIGLFVLFMLVNYNGHTWVGTFFIGVVLGYLLNKFSRG